MCNNFFKVCAPCMHMRVDDVTFFFRTFMQKRVDEKAYSDSSKLIKK